MVYRRETAYRWSKTMGDYSVVLEADSLGGLKELIWDLRYEDRPEDQELAKATPSEGEGEERVLSKKELLEIVSRMTDMENASEDPRAGVSLLIKGGRIWLVPEDYDGSQLAFGMLVRKNDGNWKITL